jgi:hypothetical protein
MKKAYFNFTIADIKALNLEVINARLFNHIAPVAPSPLLLQFLAAYEGVPLQSKSQIGNPRHAVD